MAVTEKVSWKKPCINFVVDLVDAEENKETKDWDNANVEAGKPQVKYYDVPLNSDEGDKIVDLIVSKASNCNKLKIHKILRIENPFLMASYLLSKQALIEENGANRVQSRLMLHGTKSANINLIVEENFDWGCVERSRYGSGINFTTDAVFASKFGDKTPHKELIVAWVLQAITCEGHENMDVPDPGCDTSLNKTKNNQIVVVKYDDDSFYPAYRVTYQV